MTEHPLIAFLRARLNEDRTVAEEAARRGGAHWPTGDPDQVSATMAHARRHEPARVLREVEAKMRILGWHDVVKDDVTPLGQPVETCRCGHDLPCATLRLLAEPYADHVDYREAWKP